MIDEDIEEHVDLIRRLHFRGVGTKDIHKAVQIVKGAAKMS